MSIETRVSTTRAALLDMGRPDLAERLHPQGSPSNSSERAVSWLYTSNRQDAVLLFRAAAIASLAEGYDAKNMPCEPCVLIASDGFKPDCERVTRREFLAHQSCGLHGVSYPKVNDEVPP